MCLLCYVYTIVLSISQVVELMSEADVMEILPEVIVVLLKSYDHTESSVRKASVFCLVAIYNIIGDKLKEKLADLPGSKVSSLMFDPWIVPLNGDCPMDLVMEGGWLI